MASPISLDDLPDVVQDLDPQAADASLSTLNDLDEALDALITDIPPPFPAPSPPLETLAELAASSMQPSSLPPPLVWQMVAFPSGRVIPVGYADEAEVVSVYRRRTRLFLDDDHAQHASLPTASPTVPASSAPGQPATVPPSSEPDPDSGDGGPGDPPEHAAPSQRPSFSRGLSTDESDVKHAAEVAEEVKEEAEREEAADGLHVAYAVRAAVLPLHPLPAPNSPHSLSPDLPPPSTVQLALRCLHFLLPADQSTAIAEYVHSLIALHQPALAGRITRHLLRTLDHSRLLVLLEDLGSLQTLGDEVAEALQASGEADQEEGEGKPETTPLYECKAADCFVRLARLRRERLLSVEAHAAMIYRRAAARCYMREVQTNKPLAGFSPYLRGELIQPAPLREELATAPVPPLVAPFALVYFHQADEEKKSPPGVLTVPFNSVEELRLHLLSARRAHRASITAAQSTGPAYELVRQLLLEHWSERWEEAVQGEDRVEDDNGDDANTLRLLRGELHFQLTHEEVR